MTARGLGQVRLTPLGVAILLVLLAVAIRPPDSVDGQLASLVWASVLGIFLLGTAWPIVASRRVAVTVEAPRDVTVGDEADLTIELTGRVSRFEIRILDPSGRWHAASSPSRGSVSHLALHRGVYDSIRVELRSTAPLGVVAAHRTFTVPLPRPTEIAPRPLRATWNPAAVTTTDGSDHHAAQHVGDVVRSVRPYVPGDPAHLVHWPSSAHTGGLVVKELESPTPTGLAIIVDLRGDAAAAEQSASYAAGVARAVLGAGGRVLLGTWEASGPVLAQVSSLREAGRRLARAVPGPPPEPPPGWPVLELGS